MTPATKPGSISYDIFEMGVPHAHGGRGPDAALMPAVRLVPPHNTGQ